MILAAVADWTPGDWLLVIAAIGTQLGALLTILKRQGTQDQKLNAIHTLTKAAVAVATTNVANAVADADRAVQPPPPPNPLFPPSDPKGTL